MRSIAAAKSLALLLSENNDSTSVDSGVQHALEAGRPNRTIRHRRKIDSQLRRVRRGDALAPMARGGGRRTPWYPRLPKRRVIEMVRGRIRILVEALDCGERNDCILFRRVLPEGAPPVAGPAG